MTALASPRMTALLLLLAMVLLFAGCAAATGPVSPRQGDQVEDRFLRAARNRGKQPPINWRIVQRYTFDDPASIDDMPQVAGRWKIVDGALVATEGEGDRTIMIRPGGSENMRIQFDVTLTSVFERRLGDITVLIGATADKDFFNTGYTLTTGSFWNNVTTIYRKGKALANTQYSPLEPGRTYRVTVDRIGGHLRYWLNDQIILEAWDRDPLALPEQRWLGIRTWHTRMRIDDLTISEVFESN